MPGRTALKETAPTEIDAAKPVKVRRHQKRAVQTRDNIINAAMVEFAQSGFSGATTRSIAKRANVAHGLVIYHFETKQGVWEAVMNSVIATFHEEFLEKLDALRGLDDVTKLRLFQRQAIRLSAKRPELNWLMSHEVGDKSGRLSWIIERIAGQDIAKLFDLIRSAQRQGRYVEGDPRHLHYLFMGCATRIFMLSGEVERTMEESPFDEAFIEKHIDLCERLFFRDPPAKSE